MKHHVLISGTGRAGTTFVVQLLTQLGLDTGFKHPHAQVDADANAGMEINPRRPDAPYIVKSFHGASLRVLLDEGETVIDHAIIPVRELFAAAESRRDVERRARPGKKKIAGGLWGTSNPHKQEVALTLRVYNLLHTLAKHDVPTTLLYFPRLVQEPDYLYRKLAFLLGSIEYETFGEAFAELARPELIHDFQRPPVREAHAPASPP